MEILDLLRFISKYSLSNLSLIKRGFKGQNLKDLKGAVKESEQKGFITRQAFSDFTCFSLSKTGFQELEINHDPNYQFSKFQAETICLCNHLRFGIENELSGYSNLNLKKWVSSGKFNHRPLITKVNGYNQMLKPHGLAIVEIGEKHRLFFIHHWNSYEVLSHDFFLYFLIQKRREHCFRFFLPMETELRVLCLIPSLRESNLVIKNHKFLNKLKLKEHILFLEKNKTHVDAPLNQKIWMDYEGKPRSII